MILSIIDVVSGGFLGEQIYIENAIWLENLILQRYIRIESDSFAESNKTH